MTWQREGRKQIKELLDGGADIAKLTQAKRNQERLDKISEERAKAKASKLRPKPKQRGGDCPDLSVEKEQGGVDSKDVELGGDMKAGDEGDSDVDLS